MKGIILTTILILIGGILMIEPVGSIEDIKSQVLTGKSVDCNAEEVKQAEYLKLKQYIYCDDCVYGLVVNCKQQVNYEYGVDKTELLKLTNETRSYYGLNELKVNPKLENVAHEKANQMIREDLWSHVDSKGQLSWHLFKENNYDYVKAGENLAKGQVTNEQVMQQWFNSPTHKAVLLGDYEDIGFYVTQTDNWGYLIVMEVGKV